MDFNVFASSVDLIPEMVSVHIRTNLNDTSGGDGLLAEIDTQGCLFESEQAWVSVSLSQLHSISPKPWEGVK